MAMACCFDPQKIFEPHAITVCLYNNGGDDDNYNDVRVRLTLYLVFFIFYSYIILWMSNHLSLAESNPQRTLMQPDMTWWLKYDYMLGTVTQHSMW